MVETLIKNQDLHQGFARPTLAEVLFGAMNHPMQHSRDLSASGGTRTAGP
jgi:hypothetical protein